MQSHERLFRVTQSGAWRAGPEPCLSLSQRPQCHLSKGPPGYQPRRDKKAACTGAKLLAEEENALYGPLGKAATELSGQSFLDGSADTRQKEQTGSEEEHAGLRLFGRGQECATVRKQLGPGPI